MRALFCPLQTQSQPSKIACVHPPHFMMNKARLFRYTSPSPPAAPARDAALIDQRSRWIGDTTHLAQNRDLLNRVPDSRKVLDLLVTLEKQANKAGGRVHSLIGNHELMNFYEDLRCVSPASSPPSIQPTPSVFAKPSGSSRAERCRNGRLKEVGHRSHDQLRLSTHQRPGENLDRRTRPHRVSRRDRTPEKPGTQDRGKCHPDSGRCLRSHAPRLGGQRPQERIRRLRRRRPTPRQRAQPGRNRGRSVLQNRRHPPPERPARPHPKVVLTRPTAQSGKVERSPAGLELLVECGQTVDGEAPEVDYRLRPRTRTEPAATLVKEMTGSG